MFADPEIPVRVPDPLHVDIFAKIKTRLELGPAEQLIENDPVINALDPDLAALVLVEELTAALPYTR